MKRKSFITKIIALCLVCFILVTPLTINAVNSSESDEEYLVNEEGTVMSGQPEHERIYTIYTQSGRAFDVMNGRFDDNSTVWTYPYNGDKCQEWRFIKCESYYAIQDTNSQKYLTVLDNSPYANAQIVISSKPASGFSSGQLFSVQQIGTSMRYRIFTKCSDNQSLAIGYDSSHRLRQMATTETSTQIYLEESAVYHGVREGFIHIQEYNLDYSTNDVFLGVEYGTEDLRAMNFHKVCYYKWLVRYRGGGCFSFINYNNAVFLSYSSSNVGYNASTDTYNEETCLWRIIKNNGYYEIVPNDAYSKDSDGIITINACLGVDNNDSPMIVSPSSPTRKWRIIRSHYYYNYDLSMYVIEDDSHKDASNRDETHAYIFDYVCSALYKYGFDNQNLHYEVDDELDVDEDADGPIDDITDMIDLSNLFIIYAHGKEDGSEIILNAKDSLNNYKGTKISYHRSNITNLPADSLDSLGCAIFFVCHSAQGIYANESSANFVNAVMGRGAQSAIGFDGQVACDDIDSFSLAFFAQYSDMVGNIPVRALEAYEAAVFYGDVVYTNGFSPYFTNEYISLTKPN